VGRPEAAIGHLHHPRLGIGGRSPRLLLCLRLWRYRLCLVRLGDGGFPGLPCGTLTRLLLLLRLQRFGDRQRLLDAPRTVVRRPMARRHLSPAGRARVLLEFGAQPAHPLFRLLPANLQRAVPAERRRPGSGTPSWATRSSFAAPILSNAVKLSASNCSSAAPCATRKSASVLAFMPTPPHSHWKAICSSHSRASSRALPIPCTVAYSHSASRMRGSAGGCPG